MMKKRKRNNSTPATPPLPSSSSAPILVPSIFNFENPRNIRSRLGRTSSIRTQEVVSNLAERALAFLPQTNSVVGKLLGKIHTEILSQFEGSGGDTVCYEPTDYFRSTLFADDLCSLAQEAESVLLSEPRILSVSSPVHIFGDLHGNIVDLSYFKRNIWPLGVPLTAGRFLFLGDYVDRGAHGLEVIAYLFALKVALPEKVLLLRGNHETRAVNGWEDYYGSGSFLAQCKARYGRERGEQVWEVINAAFDVMPLCAIVDNSIFCVHGGIPRQVEKDMSKEKGNSTDESKDSHINDTRLQDILNLPVRMGVRPPLEGEERQQNRLCVDLMWSDPSKAYQEELLGSDGFGQGQRGADAICFGTQAVEDFLARFGLNFVVRAHEPAESGIEIAKSGKVLTVFSTSKDHGCGDEASCGCLLVDGGRIIAINRDVNVWNFVDPRDT